MSALHPLAEAWIAAVEERRPLDAVRLGRGRALARERRVVRLDAEPGRLVAMVRDTKALPYRVSLTVPVLTDDRWQQVAQLFADRGDRLAALIDGDLPPEVLEALTAAGISLVPDGPLQVTCSCTDHEPICKHVVAVGRAFADQIDADPYLATTLRGQTQRQLTARAYALQSGTEDEGVTVGPGGGGPQVPATLGGGAVVDPGTVARDAWARTPSPALRALPLPPSAQTPSGWRGEPPRGAPFTTAGLAELGADAAQRAFAQLTQGAPSQLDLDETADLARRASSHLQQMEALLAISRRAGLSAAALTQQAVAWRHAGAEGLGAVEDELWRPPQDVIDIGLDAFDEAGIDPDEVQVRSNRFTIGDVQLRVTADLRWWRYERRGRAWELVEPPVANPGDLISG